MDKRSETGTERAKKLDLSIAQVAGSALAAAAAAYLAGRLGVYGTIIGAGVVSVVATTGGTIFQHLFRRTGEQIREAAVTTRPRPRRSSVVRPPGGAGAAMVLPTFDRRGAEDGMTSVAASGDGRGPDAEPTQPLPRPRSAAAGTGRDAGRPRAAEETQVLSAVAPTRPPGSVGVGAGSRATDRTQLVPRLDQPTVDLVRPAPPRRDQHADPARTALLPRAVDPGTGPRRPGRRPAPAGPGDGPEEVSRATYGTRLRGWRRPATGVGVFLLAMAGVTGAELATGHSPDGSPGTTWQHFAHHDTQERQGPSQAPQAPAPSPSASDTPSGGDDRSPSPSASEPERGGTAGASSDTGSASRDHERGSPTPTPSASASSGDDTGSGETGRPPSSPEPRGTATEAP